MYKTIVSKSFRIINQRANNTILSSLTKQNYIHSKPNFNANDQVKANEVTEDLGTEAFPITPEFSPIPQDPYTGVSAQPFPEEVSKVLLAKVNESDIEIKPDGLIYLPEIKFRRILNKSFGPGGWGLVPRGDATVTQTNISREYALFCLGQYVSQARGEQQYFDKNELSVALEGARSNALTRCCKDLGIASELWDPTFIRSFKLKNCEAVWVEHQVSKKKRLIWRLKGNPVDYPYKLSPQVF